MIEIIIMGSRKIRYAQGYGSRSQEEIQCRPIYTGPSGSGIEVPVRDRRPKGPGVSHAVQAVRNKTMAPAIRGQR